MITGRLRFEYPSEVKDENGDVSRKRLLDYHGHCVAKAKNAAEKCGLPIVEHRVRVLVDMQGIYLGILEWAKSENITIQSGKLPARLAHYMIEDIVRHIKEKVITRHNDAADFEDFVRRIFKKELDDIRVPGRFVKFDTSVELFYADVPLAEIDWRLRLGAKNGSAEPKVQLNNLQKGLVKVHSSYRDYSKYDSFIKCMKDDVKVAADYKGFYNFFVDKVFGLNTFDEKGVDAEIVMRATDSFYLKDCDAICIVSSDQDFLSVYEKLSAAGLECYQADAAKFYCPDKVGKRLKALNNGYIQVSTNPQWPMLLLSEALGHDVFHGIPYDNHIGQNFQFDEISSLCRLHNQLNSDYAFNAVQDDNGYWIEVSL